MAPTTTWCPETGFSSSPRTCRECDPGFEATTGSKPYIVAAILALPPGSEAVVANHSETLYSIITETTGVDTSDPVLFPKEDGSTTRVRNFNDLWVVRLRGTRKGQADSPLRFRPHAAKGTTKMALISDDTKGLTYVFW